MSLMDEIIENRVIGRIAGAFERPPCRLNDIHEADAEIIDLGSGSDRYLAVTTDALVEEVSSGLYDDPFLIGWMLATVNFSDLAAVGADPLGLLVSMNLPRARDEAFVGRLSQGISEACRELGTFVLGGDTNEAHDLLLSGTAVGLVPKDRTIRRVGARTGDRLYLSGPGGLGNVYAFLRLARPELTMPDGLYRPVARIVQGKIVRRFAECCMDTSDGLVHTIDTLMRLNRRRFVLDGRWERSVHPFALEVCRSQGLPAWLPLAGVHGEFELCFSVDPRNEDAFLAAAAAASWTPLPIGEVAAGEGVWVKKGEASVPLDSGLVRNLSAAAGSDQQGYIRRLLDYALAAGI